MFACLSMPAASHLTPPRRALRCQHVASLLAPIARPSFGTVCTRGRDTVSWRAFVKSFAPLRTGLAASELDRESLTRSGFGCSGGVLHDELWSRHALQRIQEIVDNANHRSACIFSVGSSKRPFSQPGGLALSTFFGCSSNGMQGDIGESRCDDSGAAFDFDFQVPGGGCHDEGDVRTRQDQRLCSGVFFFMVVSQRPGRAKILKASKHVPMESVAIAPLDILQISKAAKNIRAALESVNGCSDGDSLGLLTPPMLSVTDARSLTQWRLAGGVGYDLVGLARPGGLDNDIDEVLLHLVAAQQQESEELQCFRPAVGSVDGQHAALRELCRQGFAQEVHQNLGGGFWALSSKGVSSLQVYNTLEVGPNVVWPRASVPLEELSTIELHTMLATRGWVCRVRHTGGRKKAQARTDPCPALVPVDYQEPGGVKIWWLSVKQKSFQRLYFLALLKYETHRQPVPHLSSDQQYACILAGKPYTKRASRASKAFDFGAEGIHPDARPRMRSRRKAFAGPQKRRRRDLAPMPAAGAAGEDDEDCDAEEGLDAFDSSPSSGEHEVGGEDACGDALFAEVFSVGGSEDVQQMSSESDDSESGESACSSAGRSDAEASPSAASGAQGVGVEAAAADSAVGQTSRRGQLHEDTFYWGGCKFTYTRSRSGELVGLEVTCYAHKGGSACRRTRSFAAHGGNEGVLKKLKWWVVQCQRPDCSSKQSHVRLRSPARFPSDAALDEAAAKLLR